MKNKFDLSLLFNPFTRIAGTSALFSGIIIVAITVLLGYKNNIIYDGVIDIHAGSANLSTTLGVQLISVISLILIMYVAGKIFSASSIRFIDVVGTMLVARTPLLLVSLVTFLPQTGYSLNTLTNAVLSGSLNNIKTEDWIYFAFTISIFIISTIWMIILSYNAFKVSCNVKGIKNGIVFTISFILAEIVSKLLIFLIFPSLFTATMPNVEPAINNAPINDIEKQIVIETTQNIKDKEYEKASAYFDETLKQALPADKLGETITQVESKLGKIINIEDNVTAISHDGYRILLVPVQFEKATVNFRYTLNTDNQIAGFFL